MVARKLKIRTDPEEAELRMTDICHWISLKSFPRPVTSSGWSPRPGWMVGRGWLPSLPGFVHPWLIHYSFVQFITGRHRGTGQQRANFDLHRREREREREKNTFPRESETNADWRWTSRIFRRVCLKNVRRVPAKTDCKSNQMENLYVYLVTRIESSIWCKRKVIITKGTNYFYFY